MFRFSLLLPLLLLGAPGEGAEPTLRSDSDRSSSAVQGAVPPTLKIAPTELTVRVDASRGLGSPSATLAIVEFGDYQCPYCRSFHVGTLPKLQQSYINTGKVRYFYKDFPLKNHTHASGASVTAHCAGAQQRYWQMHDRLYAEQARLGPGLYEELIKELKLDVEGFKACVRSNAVREAIEGDVSDGRAIGITATPSFVLGVIQKDQVVVKRVAAGAPPFEAFVKEIESLSR